MAKIKEEDANCVKVKELLVKVLIKKKEILAKAAKATIKEINYGEYPISNSARDKI